MDWLAGRAERIGPASDAAYEAADAAGVAVAARRARRLAPSRRARREPDAAAARAGRAGGGGAPPRSGGRVGSPRAVRTRRRVALSLAEDADAIADAHERLLGMGARPAAAAAARRLRERGVRGIPRGPRRSTRQNPAQPHARASWTCSRSWPTGSPTPRSPQRLFVSSRTVDHHVSAILRKLDVPTRARAVAAAAAAADVAAPDT